MKGKHRMLIAAMGLGALITMLTPAVAFPQGPGVSIGSLVVDPKTFPEPTVTVAVLDANGLIVPNLAPENFQVLEDSRPVSVLTAKTISNPDAPNAVCLAIDVSGSMAGQPIEDAKAAARAFIDSLGPKDQVCIVAFSDKVDTSTPLVFNPAKEMGLTNDRNALKNMIDTLVADQTPGTPLYDAALKAIKITASQPPGTRAVILFTDGKDERLGADGRTLLPGSASTLDRPIAAAKEAHIPVFTIGLGKEIDSRYLQRLAEETGGKYQEAPTSDKLTGLFQSIGSQLKTQYTLKYRSPLCPDGKDHILQVRVRIPAGEAETRATLKLSKDVIPQPCVLLYYKEGDERKDLTDGQKFKGATVIAPQIATSNVISYTVFLIDSTPVYTTTVVPWTFSWNTCSMSAGSHTLAVRAQDDRSQVGEKSVGVEIVPGGFVDCVIEPSTEIKASLFGLAILSLLVVGFVITRARRTPAMCPRGRHIMPAGATVCPFCAEEARQATLSAVPPMAVPPTPLPPPPRPAPTSDTEVIPAGAAAEEGRSLFKTEILRRPPVSIAFLAMERGDHPGKEYTLHAGDTTIGRAGTNDIVIDDLTVGRQQAKIKLEGKDYYIYDLAATNRTLVNGKELTARRKLIEDDRIQIGSVVFVFKQAKTK